MTVNEIDYSETYAFKAFEFVKKYQEDKKRRDNNSLILTHLVVVAGLTAIFNSKSKTLDEDLAVSLLHDVLEDLEEVTYEMLCSEFNKNIADAVKKLTDEKQASKQEAFELSKIRLFFAEERIQKIKFADIVSNTHSIEELEPHRAIKYLKEKAEQVNILSKISQKLINVFLPKSVKKYL